MNNIKCYGSNVLVNPLSTEANTVKGIVYAIGTSGNILMNVNDTVYYSCDDIVSGIVIDGIKLDAVLHYKIFAREIYNKEKSFEGFGDMIF